MKSNYKTLMKISLSLMIAGFGLIKPATPSESRFVGRGELVAPDHQQGGSSSSTHRASSASDTASPGDVSQIGHITLRNLAGEVYGEYEVDLKATLAKVANANRWHGQFVLPGALGILDQSRTIGDILQAQNPTGESDVLTLQYVPYPTFRLDLSRLPKDDTYRTYYDTMVTHKKENIEYIEPLLGLTEDANRKMRFVSLTSPTYVHLYVTHGEGNNFAYAWSQYRFFTYKPLAVYATTDPSNFNDIAEGQATPQFFKTLLNQEGAGEGEAGNKVYSAREPTADNPFGHISFWYGTRNYICLYIKNGCVLEYVLIELDP